MAYNRIIDFIEDDESWDGLWRFKRILDHSGPYRKGDKEYMGSKYNVLVESETGERAHLPLNRPSTKDGVYQTDPVPVAIYAREQGLLNWPGWDLPGI